MAEKSLKKPVLGNGRKARLVSVSSHSNVEVTQGLDRACQDLPACPEEQNAEHSHTEAPGLSVTSMCKLTSPVLEMWSF